MNQSLQRLFSRARHSIVLTSVAMALASPEVPVDNLIRKVETRYNGAQTLRVHFVEHYSILGHPRPPESGTVTLRKKGKMRWDYERPAGKLFLSDGKTVYMYTASDHRVEKVPLRETDDMRAPLGFLLGKLDLRKEFQNFSAHEATGGTSLLASAKNERVPYESVEMFITPSGSIKELMVKGRDQSLLSFTFDNEVLNPSVPESAFHFDIPADAQVVDAIESRGESH